MRFHKLSGAGNDFVLLARAPRAGLPSLARRLCDRRRGVGADGLLVVEKRPGGPFLRYFNADGSAAFCGNGSRCAAWWLHREGWTKGRRVFELGTSSGVLAARVTGPAGAALRMPQPRAVRLGLELRAAGRRWTVHSLDTGVPHAVVPVRGLAGFPVAEVGKALRRHKTFGPAGANVDFIEYAGRGRLALRTFERGVEAETLACGTGAVAAAAALRLLGRRGSRVRLRTRGGAVLTVSFQDGEVWLEGPVRLVFSGEIP